VRVADLESLNQPTLCYPSQPHTQALPSLSKSFNFCLLHLASFHSFVVASPTLKRNHVGTGYVLGSSAYLEVCFTVPRPAPLVLILIQNRTLAASALCLSIVVYLGLLNPYYVIWHPPYILQFPPQLWRAVTSFLITGKDLSILFDTYFCKDQLHRVRHVRIWLTSNSVHIWEQA